MLITWMVTVTLLASQKALLAKPLPPFEMNSSSAQAAALSIEVPVGPLPSDIGGPPDEAVLHNGRLNLKEESLLNFFRKRTPPAPNRATLNALIAKLETPEADAAQAELVAIGIAALPALREAVNGAEGVETTKRAREIVATLEGDAPAQLVIQAARGLASIKPAGAVKVLLDYLPYTEDTASYLELQWAIQQVAMRNGKPDPALIAALKDPVAVRRGTAAGVLSSIGGPEYYSVIRPLLKDPKPSVRLGVALALVRALDSEAVPVLIELVSELPNSLRPTAEEYLINLAGEWAVEGPKGFDVTSGKLRRAVWEAWWKNTNGELLLAEFRSRTPSEEEREKIQALIAQLAEAKTQAAAQTALLTLGKKATSQLRRAINLGTSSSEAALKCLELIERDEPNPMPQAAARLLALRKPEGTLETLLAYLGVAESDELTEQLTELLATLACPGGKADPVLIKALSDKSPLRRIAAAQAIARAKATGAFDEVKKLLEDRDVLVRARVAATLTGAGEKAAILPLIQTLKEIPLDNAWEIEDLLMKIAAAKAPSVPLSETKEAREKAVAAWEKWYKEAEASLDLTKLDLSSNVSSGQLIVLEQYNPRKGGQGRVLELDGLGKVRWELPVNYPTDAQILRNGNVLVVEQQNRVTERDRKGKILWEKYFNSPFMLERLPNGQTFLGCRNALMIVDKEGKQVFNYPYTTNTILGARRFRDGSMALVAYSGEYIRIDKSGKELKRFTIPNIAMFGLSGADILPGDRVIVSIQGNNRVAEFNAEGKEVWGTTIQQPMPPTRLNNGNTLVSSANQPILVEIDRKGKIVKEWKGLPTNPYRAFRR
ncbi:MAG: HEAT repeat domain-containing protein [Gemmataceae bacterium]